MGAAVQTQILAGERGTQTHSLAVSNDRGERGGVTPLVNGGCMR